MSYEGLTVLNYELIRMLGEGGFGSVYLAEQKQLERKAAIKILHPQFCDNDEVVERFFREAKAAYEIGHDSIIGVQNIGRLDSGEPFYVMEYFDGISLAQHISRVGPLPLDALIDIFEPIVGALAAAHDKGIVHRDLKPENIIVRERDGRVEDVKLLDFGIAKLVEHTDAVHSMTGSPMGTPRYMAPEQARDSKSVDARADVYSFAAMLFHAIAGRPPFVNKNTTDLMVAVQTQPAPALRLYAPNATHQLETVLDQCLSKDPEERPSSIRQAWGLVCVALETEELSSALSGTRPPPPRSIRAQVPTPRRLAPTVLRTNPPAECPACPERPVPTSSKGWLWDALAASVVVLIAVGASTTESHGDSVGAPALVETERALASAANRSVGPVRVAAYEQGRAPAVEGAPAVAAPPAAESRSKDDRGAKRSVRDPRRAERAKRRADDRAKARADRAKEKADRARDRTASQKPQRPKPAPTLECSASSFARVCRLDNQSEAQIQASLRRLKRCRGKLDQRQYSTIQSLLVSKL